MEVLMPIWRGYALILSVGLSLATIFWLTGSTKALAVSLAIMLIFIVVVFSCDMKKIESLDPVPPPK
jgi:hypothetical protein